MNKFAFIMVIYNKKIDDSITYNSCQTQNLIVFDNSTRDDIAEYNCKYCQKHKITYYTLNENVGLSKAYNYCIKQLQNYHYDYIVLLDDDTCLNDDYFKALNTLDKPSNIIYTPIMYNNQQIINPRYVNEKFLIEICKHNNYKSYDKLKSIENTKYLYAINSAMVIPYQAFEQFSYDEHIILDCVDDYFCQQMYKSNYVIHILPVALKHSYHMDELYNKKFEDLEIRVRRRLKDLKVYNKQHHINYFIMKLAVLVQYSISTKDLRFLKLIGV